MKHTKIICTIGPASEDLKTITAMVENGMNIARLNFSHGSYDNHAMLMKNIRKAAGKLKTAVGIMQDLQGPKIRVSELTSPVTIKAKQTVIIGRDFTMDFDVSGDVKPGHRILIEDGTIELIVKKVSGKNITCVVKTAGVIRSHKGMNLPDTKVKARILTDKDISDLKFGLKNDVDFVAMSFVRNAADVKFLKELIKKYLPKGAVSPKVVVKIELPEAIENFDEILNITDCVMVARGDLGVEVPDSQVPALQKMMIRKCQAAAKPVIVATQMLDSMIRNPKPTRAEVSDVAGAVIDKADCVMLSGESAYGKYPLEAVSEMNRIIIDTENSPYTVSLHRFQGDLHESRIAVFADSVAYLAENIGATAVISATETGHTARFLSHPRPEVPVIMFSANPSVVRQMQMIWGVIPILLPQANKVLEVLEKTIIAAKSRGLVEKGDIVVIVTGNPLGKRVNLLEVKTVH